MGLIDILNQYAGAAQAQADTPAHFDEVARQTSPSDLGSAISTMFRSDATPAFGQTIGDLFNRSNPQQQAGLLNQILQSIGPGALGAAGGVLGSLLGTSGGAATTGAMPTITPEQASQVSPEQVQEIAAHAERHDPSIIDRVGSFYAQHPGLVQSLGAAALAIGLSHLQNRR